MEKFLVATLLTESYQQKPCRLQLLQIHNTCDRVPCGSTVKGQEDASGSSQGIIDKCYHIQLCFSGVPCFPNEIGRCVLVRGISLFCNISQIFVFDFSLISIPTPGGW